MSSEPSSTEIWSMKDAAKHVGVGLPALYTRLREKGLFTLVGVDNRNMPVDELIREGLFVVEPSSYWDRQNGRYRPYQKLHATYRGLILLQATADELEREKKREKGEQPRVPSDTDDSGRESRASSTHTGPHIARHVPDQPASERPLRGAPPPNQSPDEYFAGLRKMLTQEAANP